jgi:uncharacterized protein
MADPTVINSILSRKIQIEGQVFEVEIYRLDIADKDWTLEVIDKRGTSTVWDNLFATDQEALDELMKAVREEGLAAFDGTASVITSPKL